MSVAYLSILDEPKMQLELPKVTEKGDGYLEAGGITYFYRNETEVLAVVAKLIAVALHLRKEKRKQTTQIDRVIQALRRLHDKNYETAAKEIIAVVKGLGD